MIRASVLPLLAAACLWAVPLAPLPAAQGADGAVPVTFVDVAPQAGVTDLSLGRGASMVDLDGDGLLDIVATDTLSDNAFFRQLPDHTFADAKGLWSVPQDTLHHWAMSIADYDNDGDPDIYVANGGMRNPQPNQFLRNDIDQDTHVGVFTDVTASSGGADFVAASFAATGIDYDRDGLLDIFVSNSNDGACTLLHNDGGLSFTDVSAAAGITQVGEHRTAGIGDINNDGWMDIGVGAYGTPNRLYLNQQDGTFAEIAASAGLRAPVDADFGWVFNDYDNDGWVDVYLPKFNSALGTPSRIYLNDGDLTFSLGTEFGVHFDMGHNSLDVDSDGFADIFIGTGNPGQSMPDFLFKVTSTGPGQVSAQDISVASGINSMGPTRCHGSAFGDYDDDGDVDIYTNNGGMDGPTPQVNFLWQNQGTGNNWIGLDLVGTASNRSAVGTRSVATTASGREIHLLRAAGQGFGNSDSPTQHFGLGQETAVQRIDLLWPSGIEQVLLAPTVNARRTVVETGMRFAQPSVAPGASIDLQLFGQPNDVANIYFSLDLGDAIPFPDFGGIFHLDIANFFPLINVPLDADGVAVLNIGIPPLPGLSGHDFFFQAWVHPPASADDDTITNVAVLLIQ